MSQDDNLPRASGKQNLVRQLVGKLNEKLLDLAVGGFIVGA
jgi:hypothetical protein